MNDKKDHTLKMARADLCFAIIYACNDIKPYIMRLFGTVQAITTILNDREEFKETMLSWKMDCPDCTNFRHAPCRIHT